MRKALLLSCLALLYSRSCLFCQPLPRTMLWKLSGNGLTRPSYIFGTIHLSDPRMFILGDSLLAAISSSEGFANEVDLNQVNPMITEMITREISKAPLLKEMVSKKTFEEYGPALAKKFKKPAQEITSMDILKEKNSWVDEGLNGVKMQTFLDAYLTGLAYQQGKWIGGIEDFSDQIGLLNSMVDESDIKQLALTDGRASHTQLDNMTTLYLNNDLDNFLHWMNGMDSNYRDQLLIRRNHKMAFRMDSLARTRSIVFAVGAAHLPGQEGLLQLLQSRGFRVEPVFSSKKIEPDQYAVHEVSRPWVEVMDPNGHYRAKMPGTPGVVRMLGLFTMEMYYNIFDGTAYMTYSIPLPYSAKDLDSAENAMLKQVFGGPDYKLEKNLVLHGVAGRSIIQKKAAGFKKLYLLHKDHTLYLAMAYSSSDKEASLQAINRFFESYEPLTDHPVLSTSEYPFVDSASLYQVLLPTLPNPIDNLPSTGTSIKSSMMFSIDPQSGAYFFCGSYECNRGYVFRNDSLVFKLVHESLLDKFKVITLDTFYASHSRRILEINGTMQKGGMEAKTIITVRGNRYYTLLVMFPPGKWDEGLAKKMASFSLINYPPARWHRESPPDSLFTAWAPSGFLFSNGRDSLDGITMTHYLSFDSSRVHSYVVTADTLDTYFWKNSISDLWTYQKNRLLDKKDTILSEKMFMKDSLYQYELVKKPHGGENTTRMHMWLQGNRIYRLETVQEPETIGSDNVNKLFDEFRFKQAPQASTALHSQAARLLGDLRSFDTLVARKANKALANAPFTAQEIPLLEQALLKNYPPDTSLSVPTNQQIAETIIALDDSSSVAFAKEQFLQASGAPVSSALLGLLSARLTRSNYDSLGWLLVRRPPKYALPGWVTSKWKDSLAVAKGLFPTVLPLIGDSLLAPEILDLASALLKDSLLNISAIRPWQQAVLHHAGLGHHRTRSDTLYYIASDYAVIDILQRLNTDSSNAMLARWLQVGGNEYYKQEIVLSLLKNKQPVKPAVLLELAADENTRLDLYRNLTTYKKAALFPVKYLNQSSFAESLATEAAGQFGDQDFEITFLKVREMPYKGKTSRFFFYDVYFKEIQEHRLVAAGPFTINQKDISFPKAGSDVYLDERYDSGKADSQIKRLLQQMGKN